MQPEQLALLEARTAISKELRTNNDNLGFDTSSEARIAILEHGDDWQDRWPDTTPELKILAKQYIDAWHAWRKAKKVAA